MSAAIAEDFHFYRAYLGDQPDMARQRHKHFLFSQLQLKSNMTVLDVGCGTGSAALEVAAFANVRVCGVDVDEEKIKEATRKARYQGYSDRVQFVHVPRLDSVQQYLDEQSFDAVYCIESLKGVSKPSQLYSSLYRLLRPGGKLALYEWCWTDAFDPHNRDHVRLAELLELCSGMGSHSATERTSAAVVRALRSAHLSDVRCDDLARISSRASVPWYQVLDNALSNAHTIWPYYLGDSGALGDITKEAAVAILQGGHLKLFTPMALLVGTRI